MRVIVVGAGLAGLSATESLAAAGVDVILLEAGHRFGGRTRTVSDGYINGQYAESGAEWVDSIHWRMRDLMQRFGIKPLGQPMPWTTIRRWLYWDQAFYTGENIATLSSGVFRAIEKYEALADSPASGVQDPSRPDLHPEAAYLDSISVADLIMQSGLDPVGQLFARRDSQGEFASDPENVSSLFVAQQRAFENSEVVKQGIELLSQRVAGGTGQIAVSLGKQLQDSPRITINFGTRLAAVEQDDHGVVVTADGPDGREIWQADALVLACSLVPLREVDFRTPMPSDFHQAFHNLGYGPITKTAVQFETRSWESGYGTTDSISQRLYDPSVDQFGTSGILMSYCGGEGGHQLTQYSEAERIEIIATDMRQIHRITSPQTGAFSRSWSAEKNYGGAYAVYQTGQITGYWNILRQPWGRVHLAGEHVATCTGYMEGAVESGRDVADRIVCAS